MSGAGGGAAAAALRAALLGGRRRRPAGAPHTTHRPPRTLELAQPAQVPIPQALRAGHGALRPVLELGLEGIQLPLQGLQIDPRGHCACGCNNLAGAHDRRPTDAVFCGLCCWDTAVGGGAASCAPWSA